MEKIQHNINKFYSITNPSSPIRKYTTQELNSSINIQIESKNKSSMDLEEFKCRKYNNQNKIPKQTIEQVSKISK